MAQTFETVNSVSGSPEAVPLLQWMQMTSMGAWQRWLASDFNELDGNGRKNGGDRGIINWMEMDGKMDVAPNLTGLEIRPETLQRIAAIDEFKGAWRAIGRIAPERLSALRRVATIESAASSTRIEGAKLTDRDVERLLSNLEIKSFATRDEQEVAGYADVMETVFAHWDAIRPTSPRL
jgi:hypothetical protein